MFYITAIDKQPDASEKLTIRFYSACCKGNYIYYKQSNGKIFDDHGVELTGGNKDSVDKAINFYKETIKPK